MYPPDVVQPDQTADRKQRQQDSAAHHEPTHRGPPVIYHVLLELGREPGTHPFGDPEHLYHLYLPLLADGTIDAEAWRRSRSICRVRRQRPGEPEATGLIVHGPGGHWLFDYPGTATDESGFRLEKEQFTAGEYISIKEDDGRFHTFQVISVKPI
jgi:hypothetical protein